jgi:hypothetical protein
VVVLVVEVVEVVAVDVVPVLFPPLPRSVEV